MQCALDSRESSERVGSVISNCQTNYHEVSLKLDWFKTRVRRRGWSENVSEIIHAFSRSGENDKVDGAVFTDNEERLPLHDAALKIPPNTNIHSLNTNISKYYMYKFTMLISKCFKIRNKQKF